MKQSIYMINYFFAAFVLCVVPMLHAQTISTG
jgi:hypothetical protein